MGWIEATFFLIGSILVLMALGFPVALAFLVANLVGAWVFIGDFAGLLQVVDNSTTVVSRFTLAPVPLFILMGSMFFYTGLALRVFDGLDRLMGRLPGRLSYLTVAGGTMFSTLTGSLDAAQLARFPAGYCHLAYLQTGAGFTVRSDMPGLTGPAVDALYAKGAAWLAGK